MAEYLLGQMAHGRAAEFEDSFFSDRELFDTLCSVETDLIHSYLIGELKGPRLRLFEEAYPESSPRGRRVAIEREWLEAARMTRARPSGGEAASGIRKWRFLPGGAWTFQLGAAFAALIAAAMIGWLVHRVNAIDATVASLRGSPPAHGNAPQLVASFLLQPGLIRGGSAPKRLVLPANASQVRFELQLDGPAAQTYRAVLRTVEGYELWSGRTVLDGGEIVAIVPSGVFAANDYKLTLEALEPESSPGALSSYVFSIVNGQ